MHPYISKTLANILAHAPTSYIHSWLLYFGIEAALPDAMQDCAPLHSYCEFLNALHIYADEARRGVVRHVEATHFCSHLGKDVRQCLIYDSAAKNARLIGVEYMITRELYEGFEPEEQKMWHSHEFEVKSGMLVLPVPPSHRGKSEEWDKLETEAMKEIIGLYGKTWHLWKVDRGEKLPLGFPRLMGSLTEENQVDLEEAMKKRNEVYGIDLSKKQQLGEAIELPGSWGMRIHGGGELSCRSRIVINHERDS